MKRFSVSLKWAGLAALCLGMALPSGLHADGGKKYGMAGCGWGSLLIKSRDPIPQVFAYTTNGTFGNQTFGITSETGNCTQDGTAFLDREQELFAEVNMKNLSRDAAAGRGEYLTAFATLLGCGETVHSRFAERTQAQYEKIFATDATPLQVLESSKEMARGDESLSRNCSRL